MMRHLIKLQPTRAKKIFVQLLRKLCSSKRGRNTREQQLDKQDKRMWMRKADGGCECEWACECRRADMSQVASLMSNEQRNKKKNSHKSHATRILRALMEEQLLPLPLTIQPLRPPLLRLRLLLALLFLLLFLLPLLPLLLQNMPNNPPPLDWEGIERNVRIAHSTASWTRPHVCVYVCVCVASGMRLMRCPLRRLNTSGSSSVTPT